MKKTLRLLMFLSFAVLLGGINKGFSQDATDNGKNRYQPSLPYKQYPGFYTPTEVAELTGNPTALKSAGSFVTSAELDALILEAINHCVALDGFTWNGGKTPVFEDASLIDSMALWGKYELKEEEFPNTRYKVSAKDTKLGKYVYGDGAAKGLSQVLYMNPNLIPFADDSGKYHLWPILRLSCINGLKVDKLTEFPKVNFSPAAQAKQEVASTTATKVAGKIVVIEGDTFIIEGDVIYKEPTTYEQSSGYKYENDYSYQPNYYGGGHSSSCGFGISAGFSFGYGSSCGGGYYGGGYSQNYCGGGNYGGGYYGGGDNYYNYNYVDNSINNSFNDYTNSFNDYQYVPFIPANQTDLLGQQGGGYADNNGDNNGGGGGGDVPGQQGGSDGNGKWASGSDFARNTAINWNQKTSGIKTTEENKLPSFVSNKTGAIKSTGDVSDRTGAQFSAEKTSTSTATSREGAKQENKPEVVYRGRAGAIEAEEARSNANNQSLNDAPNQDLHGREGAEKSAELRSRATATRETRNGGPVEGIVGTRHENVGGPSSGSEGGRIATTTTASREPAPKRVDQSSNGRTNANVQASRTPNSQNSGMSQKRQTTGSGSVSNRSGASSSNSRNGGGGSVSNRQGAH